MRSSKPINTTPVTEVRLYGDQDKAQSLVHAHLEGFLLNFRRNVSFQDIPTYTETKKFYDRDGRLIGTINISTHKISGGDRRQEIVSVICEPDKRLVGAAVEAVDVVIPMLRVYDAPVGNIVGWAVYYNGRLTDGECFFFPIDTDPSISTDNLGINLVKLAVEIDRVRGWVGTSSCVPMYCRDSPYGFFTDNNYGEDLYTPCYEEYPCPSDFLLDVPPLSDGRMYHGEEMRGIFEGLGINCAPLVFPIGDFTLISGTFEWYDIQRYNATMELFKWSDAADASILESSYLQGWDSLTTTSPGYWLFEHVATIDQPCWSELETDDQDDVIQYRQGHCPEFQDQGFWAHQRGPNYIQRADGFEALMQTFKPEYSIAFRVADFTNALAYDYGDGYYGYDPALDIWFTCRHSQLSHNQVQTFKYGEWTCDWAPVYTSKYIKSNVISDTVSVGYTVAGELRLMDGEVLSSWEHSMSVSGDTEDVDFHDWTPDLTSIFESSGSVHYSTDKMKDGALYHSANFADAACMVDTNAPPDYWPTVFCGAIAFTCSENDEGSTPSVLVFDGFTLDYQAAGGGFTSHYAVNGLYLPLNGCTGYFVLVTSNWGGSSSTSWSQSRYDLSTASFGSSWDRFVVRYRQVTK